MVAAHLRARPEAPGWPLLAMAHVQQQKHHEWLKGELSIYIFLVLSTSNDHASGCLCFQDGSRYNLFAQN
jgi:hypothetical protein